MKKTYFLKKIIFTKTYPKDRINGVHKIVNKKQNSKTLETFLQKIMFRKKCLKDWIDAVERKAIEKTQVTNYLRKKFFPQKTIRKIVPLIVHRKDIQREN